MNVMILLKQAFGDDGCAVIDNPLQISHLHTTLKAQVGDSLKIGQLGGNMGTGIITHLDEKVCQLTNVTLTQNPPNKLGVTVILALPRPKVLRRLILDMTAFGVNHIIIVNSARTDKSYWGSPLLNKIDDFILEGLQQGVDTIPPTITFEKRFKPFVEDKLPTLLQNQTALVLHPYIDISFKEYTKQHPLPNIIIVGAEGGFVPYEIDLLQSMGAKVATLGNRILRTESAVNALLGHWL